MLQDKDLRPLRERREWLDAQDELRGLVKSSARRSLRAEAKTPFRFARSVIFGALGASASVALLITITRLIAILAGPGDKADLPVGHLCSLMSHNTHCSCTAWDIVV